MNPPTDIAPRVRAFLGRFFRSDSLRDDQDLFASGLVNSLMAMQIVAFVEKEFSITLGDDDLKLENFNSVDHITAFVVQKLG
jgi:acyl carrier protein